MDLSTPRRRGGGTPRSVKDRVEKTAATADRIARLVESMHQKLEVVEADKMTIQQQMEEKLQKLDVLEKRNEKFESIAERMKAETIRIREKEEDIGRRESLLKEKLSSPVILTVDTVRVLYQRIVDLGQGVATRAALLHALRTDDEIRGIFQDSRNTQASRYFEKLFQNCEQDDREEVTWSEFKTTVFGHDPGTPQSERSPTIESLVSAPDPSPPPPRQPDLSPMMGIEGTPHYARDPSPPAASHHSSASSRSSTPRTTEMQLSAMASILSGSGIDPHADIMLPVKLACANGVPFVDLTFPPALSSASADCVWSRAAGTLHPTGQPTSIAVVSGISSNRKFLSVLCLMGVPESMVDASQSSLSQGYASVQLGSGVVVVDNFFPSIDMCAVHASAGPSQVWIMLAEKALAKVKGSYALLEQSRDELAAIVKLVNPEAQTASFPMSMDTIIDFVHSAEANHLQLLTPLPTAVSKLGDVGSIYCVEAVHPKGETSLDRMHCLVWCPVISQGAEDVEVDAQWIPLTDMMCFFSGWSLVDIKNSFAQRKPPSPSFPPPPVNMDTTLESGISNIKPEESLDSKEKSTGGAELGNWQDAMAAMMMNNTAVVKEVQAHKHEAEAANKEVLRLINELEEAKHQLVSEREMMTRHMNNEKAATEQLNNERMLLEEEISQERQAKSLVLQELSNIEAIKNAVEEVVSSVECPGDVVQRVQYVTDMLDMERQEKASMVKYEVGTDAKGENLIVWGRTWRATDGLTESESTMQKTIEQMASELKELRQRVSSMDTELVGLRNERELLKVENLKLETDLKTAAEVYEEKLQAIERFTSEVQTFQEDKEALTHDKASLQDQVVKAELACNSKEEEIRHLTELLHDLDATSRQQISEAQDHAEKKISESVGQVRHLQDSVEETLKGAGDSYNALKQEYDELLLAKTSADELLKNAENKARDCEQELKITLTQIDLQQRAHLNEVASLRELHDEDQEQIAAMRDEQAVHVRTSEDERELRHELNTAMALHEELARKHTAVVKEMEEMRAEKRERKDENKEQQQRQHDLLQQQQQRHQEQIQQQQKAQQRHYEQCQQQLQDQRKQIQQQQQQLQENQQQRVVKQDDELRSVLQEIEHLRRTVKEDESVKAEMEQQINSARVEITELLREINERPTVLKGISPARSASAASVSSTERAELARLTQENEELRAANEKYQEFGHMEVMCDQLNNMQLDLNQALQRAARAEEALAAKSPPLRSISQRSDAETGRVESEIALKSAEMSRKDTRIKELEMKYDLQGRELEMALEQVARHYDEIKLREERLEVFAKDTVTLQRRVQELLSATSNRKETEEIARLKGDLLEAKEQHRQVSIKWKRVATTLQDAKKEGDELRDAMKVAAREITALHRSREEFKAFSDDQNVRVSTRLEEQEEENKHLRMEMLKVISERNILHEELTRR